ncbi:hypothetical protein EDD22DRAFT_962784 [Suillus occidentalis]|nr:hypothetical protein EDD22DRAFT_962784 [Suillus occidentalis]
MTNYNYCKYMSSHTHSTDKARQLQDEWIKTDHNFFLTWDHWVPPQVGPTISIQQENLPVGFKYSTCPKCSLPTRKQNNHAKPPTSSTMPVNKAHADAMAKKYFGKEMFDMCWETEAEAVPLVETLTDTSLTEPKYSGQSFEMCWDVEPESAPTITVPVTASVTAPTEALLAKVDFGGEAFDLCWDTNATVDAGQYDLCWDEPNSSKVASVPVINILVATPPATTADDHCGEEEHISSQADQYDMCWDDRPAAPAAEFQSGFDMCWEDSPVVGDDDHEGHPTDAHGTGTVKLAVNDLQKDPPASCSPSPAPTERSAISLVEAGEELVRQANERLARLNRLMDSNDSEYATDILERNWGLIAKYQFAQSEYVITNNDILKIQHMLQMFRQIDDPLTILELSMKKEAD